MKILPLAILLCLTGCAPRSCSEPLPSMTLGIVQKDIREGMSQDEVLVALGSPNIVTKDHEGHETWVYDKIASKASHHGSYCSLILFGGSSGSATKEQQTLTVVIKFNEAGCVHSLAYHASKF